jgi:hypothetical protein
MATFKPQYGLTKIEVAPAVQNNTDPSSLTIVPFTKLQSAVYANEANTTNGFNVEEQSDFIAVLDSAIGPKTFKWSTYTNDKQLLATLEGGTYTAAAGGKGATYAPPKTPVSINLFVKLTNQQGGGVKMYNAKISVVRTGNFSKSDLPEIEITCTSQAVGDGFDPVLEFDPPTA